MFVHLHLHTEYSLLDGAIRLKDLFPKAKEFGYEAVAMTDHGNMYGALNFYEKALAHGIKPIIGCEVYVAPRGIKDKSARSSREAAYHLVLLAKDNVGLKNLLKLVSIAHLEGFHYKPRVDLDLLREHREGLIALTACLHGEIPHAILSRGLEEAERVLDKYVAIFDGNLYLELQENGIKEQRLVNQGLIELGERKGIPLVATNDCHYFSKADAEAHDVLLCIQTNKTINDQDRMRFSTQDLYFASPTEMAERFHYKPEALKNTLEIAEKCNVEIQTGKHHFPRFPLPEGCTYEEEFERLARSGLERRLEELGIDDEDERERYRERLDYEIGVIKEKGFASYFLIVADFINWAKKKGIAVGPGRGSAAGSLVAYSMRITDIDPVRYGLVFERFLNAERTSLPDIDVDFCMKRRDEVLEYVAEKYGGSNYVAQIATFGRMNAKAVIRDVGRALGLPYQRVDKIAKLVPDTLGIDLKSALEQEPRLKRLVEEDSEVARLFTIALALEGLPRHSSTHAAGVVISDKPMVEYLPLTKGQEGETLTQFDMKCVEKVGLIKFDFLGLKTLTVIETALSLIEKTSGERIDISRIPLDDPKTYDLLCQGDTIGVFQLESSGMRDLLKRLRPTEFTDLIAVVALYRPGPMKSGMVTQYIDGKHGKIDVQYLLPELEPILRETYGVIVYQEQVMKIAQEVAGYSLGEGDILRRAMGKKIPEVMEAQRERFVSGAVKRGVDKKKAETLFHLIQEFAGYGFNKSHSACYALIAYRTAWLKAHYPVEFLASLLTNELGNTDGVLKFISDAKAHGIGVFPPDINKCDVDFTVENGGIRFGLSAVKNLGQNAIIAIVKEREKNGPYKDFEDFLRRVDPHKVNKRALESLIKCGAFDSLGYKRSQLYAVLEKAVEFSQNAKKERACGQKSLFGAIGGGTSGSGKVALSLLEIPDRPEWESLELLSHEKEALGFYISGHPLDPYVEDIKRLTPYDTQTIKGAEDGLKAGICGIIRSKKETKTKRGERMAFIVLEDHVGSLEILCFPECYQKHKAIIEQDEPIWVEGKFKRADDRGDAKIIGEIIMPLEEALKKQAKGVLIEIIDERVKVDTLSRLKDVLKRHPGDLSSRVAVTLAGKGRVVLQLPDEFNVEVCPSLTQEIEETLGYGGVSIDYV